MEPYVWQVPHMHFVRHNNSVALVVEHIAKHCYDALHCNKSSSQSKTKLTDVSAYVFGVSRHALVSLITCFVG